MEEDIQINRIFRWVGVCLCIVIALVSIFSLLSDNQFPLFVSISNMALLALFLPICVIGYIPGRLLNMLPKNLIRAIKLDFNNH